MLVVATAPGPVHRNEHIVTKSGCADGRISASARRSYLWPASSNSPRIGSGLVLGSASLSKASSSFRGDPLALEYASFPATELLERIEQIHALLHHDYAHGG